VRYDAAIIGAGANGLTAAAMLSRAGLKTLVIERAGQVGGRLVTDAFHPGFAASPFADRVPEIPAAIVTALGLDTLLRLENLPDDLQARRTAALTHIFAAAKEPRHHGLLARLRLAMTVIAPGTAWPGRDLAARPLADWPVLAAWALVGRTTDPELMGSALTLLALAGAEPARGGLGALGAAFAAAAGRAELRLGRQAGEVTVRRGFFGRRVTGLVLTDGSRAEADAVISTVDFKRSILSLFPSAALPSALTAAAAQFRTGGGTARLLLALKWASKAYAPLLLPGDGNFRAAFRRGVVPDKPPLLVDPVSVRDASLAPAGCATLTVTLAGIPTRLSGGAWTEEKRLRLAAGALSRIEAVLPGTLASLAGIRIIAPPDMEDRLGASGGDLDGGLLAPDQMLALRPGARTVLAGLYLGGASCAAGPLGTGAAGFAAATSLLADRS
jgi:phytoene dehydrogenase-like protein